MAALRHEVWIDASAATVYRLISTADSISAWWDKHTARQTGDGTLLEHDPGPEHGVVTMKVLELSEDKRIEWECISRHPKTSPASAWTGTHVIFEITRRPIPPWGAEKVDRTILNFSHTGWDENSEYFGFCNFAWGQVLQKLKQVCEAA
jgi:uncharacterized protein YndB with AHSA1/START domain